MKSRRNLWLYLPYQLFSLEGITHGLYLLWLLQVKHLSAFTIASMAAAGDLLVMLLEVPTGMLADRLGHKHSLVLGSALQVLGIVLMWRGQAPWVLGLSFLVIAAGDAFRSGADQALLYETCLDLGRSGDFQRLLAATGTWTLGAVVAETVLGGWLARHFGYEVAWAVETAVAVAGLAVAFCFRTVAAGPSPEHEPAASTGRRGIRWWLIVPGSVVVVAASSGGLMAEVSLAYVFGPDQMAWLIAGLTLLEALGSALAIRLEAGRNDLALLATMAIAATTAMGVLPGSLMPALAIVSLLDGLARPLRSALIQKYADPGQRATAASIAHALDMGGNTLWLPAVTYLLGHMGLAGTSAVSAATLAVAWWLAAFL